MEQPESNTCSFIIKVWLEEITGETGHTVWRGHVTHVPSGKRRYIQDLNAISLFIEPYLEKMGTRSGSSGGEKIG
jgi:hypothetical protein